MYVYKIFRLIIIAIIITYFIGCFWYFYCNVEEEVTFITMNQLDKKDDMYKLIVSCYYALTTLSTVGYGDYYPVSSRERIVAVVIMLGGVAFFSYIMGHFIEIISNYKKNMG
jgi:fatty acid desaturase